MKKYVGVRNPNEGGPGKVTVFPRDRRDYPLDPRFDLVNHSPTGFHWGYGGSGPAQLAVALLADATEDDAIALRAYQQFKWDVVTKLPAQFELTHARIMFWLEQWFKYQP